MDHDGKSDMEPPTTTTTTTDEESPLLQNPNPRSSVKTKVPEVEIHLYHDGKSEMEPTTTTTTTEEESPLLQNPNPRSSVETKVPEVEIHLYLDGEGPVEVLRSALGGWDQDRLDVQDLLDEHGLKSLHEFSPGSGRGAPIQFCPRSGRSLLPYKDGSVIYVDGESKDWLRLRTKIIVGIAMLILLIAPVLGRRRSFSQSQSKGHDEYYGTGSYDAFGDFQMSTYYGMGSYGPFGIFGGRQYGTGSYGPFGIIGGLQKGTYYCTRSYVAFCAMQSSRASFVSAHFPQPTQESVRVQDCVDRQIASLRDELIQMVTEQPQSQSQTDDVTITTRFDMLERSIMELRDLSQTTQQSFTILTASTERNVTELQESHVAMSESLTRLQAAHVSMSQSVEQSTSKLVSVMDSYNARLTALEQIRPRGLSASTPMTLPPPSISLTLSQEQFDMLISQMRGGAYS